MEATLEPLLFLFKERRRAGEHFGDFCARVGFPTLRDYARGYIPADQLAAMPTVGVTAATLQTLTELAAKQVEIPKLPEAPEPGIVCAKL